MFFLVFSATLRIPSTNHIVSTCNELNLELASMKRSTDTQSQSFEIKNITILQCFKEPRI